MHYRLSKQVVSCLLFFFFNDTATTEIYTLSLHDALPIYRGPRPAGRDRSSPSLRSRFRRSEEHTSELQSRSDLVCRLLLEKKKKTYIRRRHRRYAVNNKHLNMYRVTTHERFA